MLDWRSRHKVTDQCGKAFQPARAGPAHVGNAGGAELYTEEVCHQFRQPILGQQLVMLQVDDKCRDARAILDGRVHALGKGSARHDTAPGTAALVRPVFRDNERLRIGKVEDLPDRRAD